MNLLTVVPIQYHEVLPILSSYGYLDSSAIYDPLTTVDVQQTITLIENQIREAAERMFVDA